MNITDKIENAAEMINICSAYWISHCIHIVAKLGIADLLKASAKNVEELALTTGVNKDYLYRIMHALSSVNIFAEENKMFTLTELSETLLSDSENSVKDWAIMIGEYWVKEAWDKLHEGLTQGTSPFLLAHNKDLFAFLSENESERKQFNLALDSKSRIQNKEISDYPYRRNARIIDLGGGVGSTIDSILERREDLEGTLFELPHMISQLKGKKFNEKIILQEGDFFRTVPKDFDYYLMKYILHDWDDERCLLILNNCVKSMKEDSKVFIIERIREAADNLAHDIFSDINMLVKTEGRERSEQEFRSLFEKAGLELEKISKAGLGTKIMVLRKKCLDSHEAIFR